MRWEPKLTTDEPVGQMVLLTNPNQNSCHIKMLEYYTCYAKFKH